MKTSIKDRWDRLPERGSTTPDYIFDADRALTELHEARNRLTDAEREYAMAIIRVYDELSNDWTAEELEAAGFWMFDRDKVLALSKTK